MAGNALGIAGSSVGMAMGVGAVAVAVWVGEGWAAGFVVAACVTAGAGSTATFCTAGWVSSCGATGFGAACVGAGGGGRSLSLFEQASARRADPATRRTRAVFR